MKIGIDGNEANVSNRLGIGEYAYNILSGIYQLRKKGESNATFVIYLKDDPLSDMPEEMSWWQYKKIGPKKLWTQFGLPLSLFLGKRPDVFFTPTHYGPRFSPVPTVISVMDLSYLHFPQLFAKKDLYQLVHWTKYSVKKAKKIFTISNASKGDIIKEYHVAANNVVVTYPGIKEESRSMNQELSKNELEKQFGITGDYLLFVGTLQPRKNIERLVEAFSLLKREQEYQNLQLVIVGKKGWLYESILQAPEKYSVTESVKFLDFVSNDDLPSLYKHAICYVLPSLYEGFGLPVVEAMKYGTPVITSNVSSLPEAGGDAAVYIDPQDSKDIARKLKQVIDDPQLRAEMVKKGYTHIKQFSWEKAAKETLKVLEEIADHTYER